MNQHGLEEDVEEPFDQLIFFPGSDGDSTHRPPADKLNGPSNPAGYVDYMRKVGINEAPAKSWRLKIGNSLRKELNLDMKKEYYLAGWPKGYELYVHYKTVGAAPRNDLYLYGGPAKFRSANEFYPHALWLLKEQGDDTRCGCKYCGDQKYQRIINYEAGLGPPVSEHQRPGASRNSNTRVRKVLIHPLTPSSPLPSSSATLLPSSTSSSVTAINQNRDSDLRSQRPFRTGEIVWCPVEPPLSLHDSEEISWWPAAIQSHRFRPDAPSHDSGTEFQMAQVEVYRLRLLGTSAHYRISERNLLPWLAYRPTERLQRMLHDTSKNGSAEDLLSFCPMPNPLLVAWNTITEDANHPPSSRHTPGNDSIDKAPAAYSLALTVASKVVNCWVATDRWTFEAEGINDTEQVRQTRFQGIWWGSERIWAGDLVRIKPSLAEFLVDEDDLLKSSAMADTRSMFVRINSVYLAEEGASKESAQQVPMFAGALFELAEAESSDISFGPRETSPIYSPPPPPIGFKWRMLTPSIYHEIHFNLTDIAGRYYPGLVPSPLLAPVLNINSLEDFISSPQASNYLTNILALGGLAPGRYSGLDPKSWMSSRTEMFASAHQAAVKELFIHDQNEIS